MAVAVEFPASVPLLLDWSEDEEVEELTRFESRPEATEAEFKDFLEEAVTGTEVSLAAAVVVAGIARAIGEQNSWWSSQGGNRCFAVLVVATCLRRADNDVATCSIDESSSLSNKGSSAVGKYSSNNLVSIRMS